MAAEEPRYDVLTSTDDYEIRRYEPYLVAETDVEGPYGNAGNKAFNILAGYIFGKNRQSEKMAMTVPVESRPADAGVRMAMTAPVTSRPSDADPGLFTYAFVMERKYTLDTLPEPVDPRIRIREVLARGELPAARAAAASGAREGRYSACGRALFSALQCALRPDVSAQERGHRADRR